MAIASAAPSASAAGSASHSTRAWARASTARPYPAVPHSTRCPARAVRTSRKIHTEPSSAPADGAAESSPYPVGPACSTLSDSSGSSTRYAPNSVALRSSAMSRHTTGSPRTYASPSRILRHTPPRLPSPASGGTRSTPSTAISVAYVTVSRTYTAPGPPSAMSTPASAGPSSTASSREGLSRAKAATSWERGTIAGMSACRAGWSKVAAAVASSEPARTAGTVAAPVRVRRARASEARSASDWLHWSRRRRSSRSASTPPSGERTSSATACARPTRPTCAVEPVSW
ncbi:hypothetical protein GA0115246_101517 [Streptomyces sp. SolWspMP-sol7th]|nr:hypothetical protein GA0115246_101517 [Streptomyces sp. SolWspMP-sol7th]